MPSIKTGPRNQPWYKPREPFKTMKVEGDFYNTPDWRRFRKQYIATHPLCVECEKQGRITSSKVVDHITPINEGGGHFDMCNLQALCHKCHNAKSAMDGWRRRRSDGT